jgi:hypothetical protein
MMMTTGKVLMGTRPTASLRWRSATEDATEMTVTYVTSSAAEIHMAGSRTGAETESMTRSSDVTKGTMTIMVPIMISPTGIILQVEDIS